jgi:DNA polymerase III alpha subunit
MDIDIDFADRTKALACLKHINASREENGKLVKHNTGVYFHEVPYNPLENFCAISHNQAEELGYFKIDFLNVNVYKGVRDEQHLDTLLNQEPLWDLLEQDDFVNLLFHINGYGHILRQMKPKNLEQLAAVLAVIRPSKKYLIDKDWDTILKEAWTKPDNNEYYFKKSHSIAYAMAIVVQMNLICEGVSYEFS